MRARAWQNALVGERSWYVGGRAAALLLRMWRGTVRVEARNREILRPPYVLALWHGRMIGSIMDNFDCRAVTMASRSTDGALAAGIVDGLGLTAARGSTSRGGREALEEMTDLVRDGSNPFAALTVDGPRGPWRKVKPGIVALARRLEAPICAVTFSCRRRWVLHSWDHMVLPKPFSKIVVAYGGPWGGQDLAGDQREVADRIGREMNVLTAALDAEVAGSELWPSG